MLRRLAMLAILCLAGALAGSPALGSSSGPGLIIPPCAPNWAAVPGAPGVLYAPNIRWDLFRYQGNYYCQQGGSWYRGTGVSGPWAVVQGPPAVFYHIQAPYFKAPPGWARGKKTGWQGAPLPPGQMKKAGYSGGRIPPGQLKKMAP
jgi:hypothetical protein